MKITLKKLHIIYSFMYCIYDLSNYSVCIRKRHILIEITAYKKYNNPNKA